jgi:mannosyltransferase OCH1-like enzyme
MIYLYLLGIILIILVLLFINKKETFINYNKDLLLDEPIEYIKTLNVTKTNSPGIIPLNLFLTWNTNNMPSKMKKSVEFVKASNPEFNMYIYDDNECKNFLKKYFKQDIVDAFDSLIPGAYKADLWRYCILYKYGGVYQDIKFQPVDNFKYIDMVDKEYFVRDIKESGEGIYNALLICAPENPILGKCILQIVQNVENKYMGKSSLEPTGPLLMRKFFSQDEIDNLELTLRGKSNLFIYHNDNKILKFYDGYRDEQKKKGTTHYNYIYYTLKKIYK